MLSNEALDYLADQLSSPHWTLNREWDPLRTWPTDEPRAEGAWRWQFENDSRLSAAGSSTDDSVQEIASNTIDSPEKTTDSDSPPTVEPSDSASELTATESTPAKSTTADASSEQGSNPETKPLAGDERQKSRVWNGLQHLGLAHMVKVIESKEIDSDATSDDERLIAYLKTLSWRKGTVGDNAAILLARRFPRQSASVSTRLEELVRHDWNAEKESSRVTRGQNSTEKTMPESDQRPLAAAIPSALSRLFAPSNDVSAKADREMAFIKSDPAAEKLAAIQPAMQSAAVEAWCYLLAVNSEDPIDGLAPVGRILERPDLPVRIREEMYRSISRWVAPAQIPQLEQALKDRDEAERVPVEIRRASLEACLVFAAWRVQNATPATSNESNSTSDNKNTFFHYDDWPTSIHQSRHDSDARVRISYGRWLATTGNEQAIDVLKSQLLDREFTVRQQALVSMGLLKNEAAIAVLNEQMQQGQERVREFAVQGLGQIGLSSFVPYVDDSSSRVRVALARELGRYPGAQAGLLLRNYLLDRSPTVQKAAVAAIQDWPIPAASPVLLYGMRDGNRELRQICYRNLAKRIDLNRSFDFDASHGQRVTAVRELAQRANLRSEYLDEIRQAPPASIQKDNTVRARDVEENLVQLVRSEAGSPIYLAAYRQLVSIDQSDIPYVERFLDRTPGSQQSVVFSEILPAVSDVYGHVKELKNNEVDKRQNAALKLAESASQKTLSETALRMIRMDLMHEQDRIVWQHLMKAIADNASVESGQIALVALNHTWPDIRILGCEYVGRQRLPQQAHWLRPLLDDRNRQVQLAAITAAGHCHNPIVMENFRDPASTEVRRGLNALLSDSNESVRLQAAVSLARLGQDNGVQELLRRAADPSPGGREQIARLMGETGQSRFIKHLVRMAWTENSGAVQRMILHSLEQLTVPEERPGGLERAVGYNEKIRLWQSWHENAGRSIEQSAVSQRSSFRGP